MFFFPHWHSLKLFFWLHTLHSESSCILQEVKLVIYEGHMYNLSVIFLSFVYALPAAGLLCSCGAEVCVFCVSLLRLSATAVSRWWRWWSFWSSTVRPGCTGSQWRSSTSCPVSSSSCSSSPSPATGGLTTAGTSHTLSSITCFLFLCLWVRSPVPLLYCQWCSDCPSPSTIRSDTVRYALDILSILTVVPKTQLLLSESVAVFDEGGSSISTVGMCYHRSSVNITFLSRANNSRQLRRIADKEAAECLDTPVCDVTARSTWRFRDSSFVCFV